MNDKPIPTEINNGILSSKGAMPMKDLTSDNTASFSMSRKMFKSYVPKPNFSIPQVGNTVIERESLALSNKVVIDGGKTALQKKWIGGNRDASSMIRKRQMHNTAAIFSKSGPFSFKNVVDNNTARDARNRCRSSGYSVPPKVTQQNVIPIAPTVPDYVKYYRIVAAGLSATSGGVVSRAGSAYGVSPGIYSYTSQNLTKVPIVNLSLGTAGRSYNLMTISRETGEVTTYPIYDVFGTAGQPEAFVSQLNSFTDSVIVIVFTFDEPRTNSSVLVSAMQNCGASSNYNSTDILYRSAYILVGIPGIGIGNGLEKYVGAIGGTGDPNAWIDLNISVSNGQYTYISG